MSLYVFNQYYFDLLKKVKDYCRSSQGKVQANNVRKAIKKNYASYDKTAKEYREFFSASAQHARGAWESTKTSNIKDAKEWLECAEIANTQIYDGITVADIDSCIKSKKTLFYYFTLLCIFVNEELTQEEVDKIVGLLKNIKNVDEFEKSIESIEDALLKQHLTFLLYLQKNSTSGVSTESSDASGATREGIDETMQQLETTSLGKLAKEIMGDIDINEVQNSLTGGGNILESLTNPDGGLSKLLGTVSQKMISKMTSGEIKQETLLQDALKFSSQLQNMIPKGQGGGAGGFGDIASMMSKVGDLANMMNAGNKKKSKGDDSDSDSEDDGEGFNFAKMASMLGSMGDNGKKEKHSRPIINKPELSRVARAKQLRKKLERQKRAKEATQTRDTSEKQLTTSSD
jgi:hypothetical protein